MTTSIKVTKESYLELLESKRLRLVDAYSTNGRMSHNCLECGATFLIRRLPIIRGLGCANCEGRVVPKTRARYTPESFACALSDNPDVKVKKSSFQALWKPADFMCRTHGRFTCTARYVLTKGCPQCAKIKSYAKRSLDKETWDTRIADKHGETVRMLGQYQGTANNRRYRFKCYVCFNTWKAQLPSVAISGTGCPHCANQKKAKAGFRVKEYNIDGIPFRVQGWEYQAIVWLLAYRNIKASDILTESSSRIPVIRYKFGRRTRNYYPDLFVPKFNRIIEVKSSYTLGLSSTSRSSAKMWRQNQAKAKATLAAGYKFSMMVMGQDGTRFKLPKLWYDMSAKDVLTYVALRRPKHKPSGLTCSAVPLPSACETTLKEDIRAEKKCAENS